MLTREIDFDSPNLEVCGPFSPPLPRALWRRRWLDVSGTVSSAWLALRARPPVSLRMF